VFRARLAGVGVDHRQRSVIGVASVDHAARIGYRRVRDPAGQCDGSDEADGGQPSTREQVPHSACLLRIEDAEYRPVAAADYAVRMAAELAFAFVDGRLLLVDDELPTADRLAATERVWPVGPLGVAVALDTQPDLAGASLVGLRDFFAVADAQLAAAAGRAAQIVEWELGHAFCGRCGSPTDASETELARICPNCGATYYPRITPAVIMLVEHDGRVLLARRAGWNVPFHSVLAGFVEPGETLEQTVRREVLEEVGVEVEDVRYFGSQPWPFPSQLMIGFTARASSDELRVDDTELQDAGWFAPAALPKIPGSYTIARRLIDDFVERNTRTV
jgi:NAD+ diphosphatase